MSEYTQGSLIGSIITMIMLSIGDYYFGETITSKTLIKPDLEIKQVNGVSDTTYIYYEK